MQRSGAQFCPEAGLSVLRRAYLSRGGPIRLEAGLSIPRRAFSFRRGPVYLEAGFLFFLDFLQRRGGEFSAAVDVFHSVRVCPEAGLSVLRRALPKLAHLELQFNAHAQSSGNGLSQGGPFRRCLSLSLSHTRTHTHSLSGAFSPAEEWSGVFSSCGGVPLSARPRLHCPEAGLSILRRACLSRGGPV